MKKYFDKIYCINLDSRPDRWKECLEEFKKIGIDDIVERLRPLGFYNRRANTIIRFTHEYINKQFKHISELYGIGKYASDSYEIFIKGNNNVEPTDKILLRYLDGEFIEQ